MADRRTALLALAIGAIGTAAIFFAFSNPSPQDATSAGNSSAPQQEYPPNPLAQVPLLNLDGGLPRPSVAVAEFGILTDRSEESLKELLEPERYPELVADDHCGEACDAVRAWVAERDHVQIEVVPRQNWKIPTGDALVEASPTLSKEARKSIEVRPNVVVVRTKGVAYPDQLPARAAFAITATLAEQLDGLVYDQLIDRIESAPLFMTRTITEPLGTSIVRADRFDVQRMARKNGKMRVLTVGLARFGAPDIEVPDVSPEIGARLAGLLSAVAKSIVDGASTSPVTIQNQHGATMSVEVVGVHVEEGDPNVAMVRVLPNVSEAADPRRRRHGPGDEPAGASSPVASASASSKEPELPPYEALARAFGAISPSTDQVRIASSRVQRELPKVLERQKQTNGTLFVQLQFPMTGGGNEWMWIQVKGWDENTVTGTVIDNPVDVAGVSRGTEVKRPRSDIMDYVLKLPDGGFASTVGMSR